MNLLPPNILERHPDSCYEFESQDELRKNIVYANQNEILYTLYRDVKKFYTEDYFVDISDTYGTFDIVYDYVLFSGQVCKRTEHLQHRR
jgi:hypothetical protein